MRDLGVSSYSLADVMDNIVSRAVTAQMLRPSDRVYEEVERSVTSINTYSFVHPLVDLRVRRAAHRGERDTLGTGAVHAAAGKRKSAELSMLTNDGERRIGPSLDGRILGSEMEEERLPDDDFYATRNVFP
eukprot:IDg16004t1